MFGVAAAGEVLSRDMTEFAGVGKSHDRLEISNHCGKLAVPHLGERARDARVAPAKNTVAPALAPGQFRVISHDVDHRFEQTKSNRLAIVKQKNDLARARAHFGSKLGEV